MKAHGPNICLSLLHLQLSRIEFVHNKNYIHRDIKPENCLMGVGHKKMQVSLIDYGLAKRYRDPCTRKHIPFRDDKHLTGTARYTSINSHLGLGK